MPASDDLHSRILSHGPSSDTLFILLTRMKKEGKLRKVIQACVRALDMYPNDIPIRKLLAEAFLEAGFLSQAEAEMQKVTRQITELATIYKRKAEILARQQRSQEALEAARTYLAHYPDDQDALRLLEDFRPPEETAVEEVPEEATLETPAQGPEEAELPPEIHPDDLKSREALQEQRETESVEAPAAVTGEAEDAPGDEDRVKEKTAKMITTLESWLEEIRDMAKPPQSP